MPTRNIDERGPFGRNLHLARAIRDALRADGRATPVVGAGGINSFEHRNDEKSFKHVHHHGGDGQIGTLWMLARNLFLAVQGGYVFSRNLEVRDGGRKEFDRDLGDTWFARIGLAYR